MEKSYVINEGDDAKILRKYSFELVKCSEQRLFGVFL